LSPNVQTPIRRQLRYSGVLRTKRYLPRLGSGVRFASPAPSFSSANKCLGRLSRDRLCLYGRSMGRCRRRVSIWKRVVGCGSGFSAPPSDVSSARLDPSRCDIAANLCQRDIRSFADRYGRSLAIGRKSRRSPRTRSSFRTRLCLGAKFRL
jgi:hypothetical protein